MTAELLISICLGIGLAASVGFRIFLPLLVLSIATYYDVVPLQDSWQWIGQFPALMTIGIATILEILGYFIPWFDNVLDSIAIPLAAIAGTAVMLATMVEVDTYIRWTLAIIAGGGTASIISIAAGSTRAASSASTGGLGNPIVATVETLGATALSVISVFVPILAAIIAVTTLVLVRSLYKKLFRKKRTGAV